MNHRNKIKYSKITILFNKKQLYIFEWLRKKAFNEKTSRGKIIREILAKEIKKEGKERFKRATKAAKKRTEEEKIQA